MSYTTVLHPDVKAALAIESERRWGTKRRTNMVIEMLVREHLRRPS